MTALRAFQHDKCITVNALNVLVVPKSCRDLTKHCWQVEQIICVSLALCEDVKQPLSHFDKWWWRCTSDRQVLHALVRIMHNLPRLRTIDIPPSEGNHRGFLYDEHHHGCPLRYLAQCGLVKFGGQRLVEEHRVPARWEKDSRNVRFRNVLALVCLCQSEFFLNRAGHLSE